MDMMLHAYRAIKTAIPSLRVHISDNVGSITEASGLLNGGVRSDNLDVSIRSWTD